MPEGGRNAGCILAELPAGLENSLEFGPIELACMAVTVRKKGMSPEKLDAHIKAFLLPYQGTISVEFYDNWKLNFSNKIWISRWLGHSAYAAKSSGLLIFKDAWFPCYWYCECKYYEILRTIKTVSGISQDHDWFSSSQFNIIIVKKFCWLAEL